MLYGSRTNCPQLVRLNACEPLKTVPAADENSPRGSSDVLHRHIDMLSSLHLESQDRIYIYIIVRSSADNILVFGELTTLLGWDAVMRYTKIKYYWYTLFKIGKALPPWKCDGKVGSAFLP